MLKPVVLNLEKANVQHTKEKDALRMQVRILYDLRENDRKINEEARKTAARKGRRKAIIGLCSGVLVGILITH